MDKKKDDKIKKILTGIVVVGIFVFGFSTCSGDEEKKFNPEDFSTNAAVITREFVKEKLVSPSTADFPFASAASVYVSDSTFLVKGPVDSQNGFGAMVRSNYIARIKYKGGDWADRNNWELLVLNVLPN